ncbi:hypothetical protein [Massilia antarctica]|uniref:hypothetical protein n=1 Tax=Massilia antarctica TaxID=2765360 RepID=UPI002271E49C|nr:hypothetical protein [Massilia sp. H27-R4]MCY0910899.1 hypothetical protein [Massilia sp. H27-R4]
MRTHRELYLIHRLGQLITDLAIVMMVIGAYGLAHNDEPDTTPATAQTKWSCCGNTSSGAAGDSGATTR